MKSMKTVFSLLLLCGVMAVQVQAQQTKTQSKATQAAITDEDLKKYAITMDSVKGMQETLQQIITENVQKNTVMSVERYNQLFKIETDQTQLAAANATPEELAFLKEIGDLKKENLARINSAYQALAKDYVGLKAFNAIRKSLESDAELKGRYEAIAKEVNSAGASGSH